MTSRADGPTCWDTSDHRLNSVAFDGARLRVSYRGSGSHSHDVGAVRADAPFSARRSVAYFEVTIVDTGARR